MKIIEQYGCIEGDMCVRILEREPENPGECNAPAYIVTEKRTVEGFGELTNQEPHDDFESARKDFVSRLI